ncbi:MAG: hypothetical protein QG671_4157 [Actinomycetota bacterium]|nr:hypothetical protein [Actinomycetota bacterium]
MATLLTSLRRPGHVRAAGVPRLRKGSIPGRMLRPQITQVEGHVEDLGLHRP